MVGRSKIREKWLNYFYLLRYIFFHWIIAIEAPNCESLLAHWFICNSLACLNTCTSGQYGIEMSVLLQEPFSS